MRIRESGDLKTFCVWRNVCYNMYLEQLGGGYAMTNYPILGDLVGYVPMQKLIKAGKPG